MVREVAGLVEAAFDAIHVTGGQLLMHLSALGQGKHSRRVSPLFDPAGPSRPVIQISGTRYCTEMGLESVDRKTKNEQHFLQ